MVVIKMIIDFIIHASCSINLLNNNTRKSGFYRKKRLNFCKMYHCILKIEQS